MSDDIVLVTGGSGKKRVLAWAPRSNEEAIVATAESLARLGRLKHAHN